MTKAMARTRLKEMLGRFWKAWRGWILLGVFLLAVVIVLAALATTGIVQTGFGEYTPPTPYTQRAKTLWDWMGLCLVPLGLALVTALFTWATTRQGRIEAERAREATLQTYLDRMAELGREGLRESMPDDIKRSTARAQTLAALRQLDGERKGLVLEFLHESGLVGGTQEEGKERREAVVDLRQADLSQADLSQADLSRANLRGANLRGANLSRANLCDADLHEADLTGADLSRADLTGANVIAAYLTGANLRHARLPTAYETASTLKGATMPDGTKHKW